MTTTKTKSRMVSDLGAFGNILPNTQWQVFTACTGANFYDGIPSVLHNMRMMDVNGSAYVPATIVSSVGATGAAVQFNVTDTSALRPSWLVAFDGTAPSNCRLCTLQIEGLVTDSLFTCTLPLGLSASSGIACSAYPISPGDTLGTGGDFCDGWQKSAAAYAWRDVWTENAKQGSLYSAGFKKTSGSAQYLYHIIGRYSGDDLTPADGRVKPLTQNYLGKILSFGTGVYHKVHGNASTWRPYIRTDAGYTYGPSGTAGQYDWQEVTLTIPTNSTFIEVGVSFDGASSDVYYVSQPMCAQASYLGSWNYQQPTFDFVRPVVKFTDVVVDSLSVTFPLLANGATDHEHGFQCNLFQQTNGLVAPTVVGLLVTFEGTGNAAGHSLALKDNNKILPVVYSSAIYCAVSGVPTAGGQCTLELKNGGYGLYTGDPGSQAWSGVSMDINGYYLSWPAGYYY